MNGMNEQVLVTLKEERDGLERNVKAAAFRIGQLNVAIDALEGKPIANGNGGINVKRDKSVMDMIKDALLKVEPGQIFDGKVLANLAAEFNPDETMRLKRGVYNCINSLLEKKLIIRVPNGYQKAP